MIVKASGDFLAHSGKSKSKYKGGFKNGKNTSAYNHDYYIHNKEKWKDKEEVTRESPNDWNSIYEDKYEHLGTEYDGDTKSDVYYNKRTGDAKLEESYTTNGYVNPSRKRNGGKMNITDPKTLMALAKQSGDAEEYKRQLASGDVVDVKSAKVYKRGDGIGGDPSGNKEYNDRSRSSDNSSNKVKKRKRGRKPIGHVVFTKK